MSAHDPEHTEESDNLPTSGVPDARMGLSRKLLERLVCPVSRGPLTYDAEAQTLTSPRAGLIFPVRDGIPILVEDQAEPIHED